MPQDFDDFFLKEYQRISEAYFSTMNSISQFMKHYVALASIPLALAALFGRPGYVRESVQGVLTANPAVALFLLLLICAVSFLLALYLFGLHLDAVLYAKTINGVRGYFAAQRGATISGTQFRQIERLMVLPIDPREPSFFSGTIWALVSIFGLIVGDRVKPHESEAVSVDSPLPA